jgi:diacylglycerol kinase (ATP)
MANTENKGLKRIYNAFFHTIAGFVAAWKNEEAFQQEVMISVVLIPTAFWVGDDITHISLLLFTVFAVLVTELLNTGIENAIDRISDEHHELSKRAKDVGSAAVFVSFTALIIVWCLAIYAKFF